jgi:hypothetical protein
MTHTRRHRAEGLVEDDPSYEGMDDSEAGHRSALTDKRHWGALLAIVAAIGLLALVIVLHVTGVLGPGAH